MRLKGAFVAAVVLGTAPGCFLLRDVEPAPYRARPAAASFGSDLQAYWVGHATVLVRMGDRWLITDPNFTEALGGVVKRYVEPGIDVSDLPAVDVVLVSHAHMDHLDHASLEQLNPDAALALPIDTPLPDGMPFAQKRWMEPWESFEYRGMKITAVPVSHFGGRWMIDGLWRDSYTGYVVEYGGHTVFFAGDTGYDPDMFLDIGDAFAIDLALVPVGPVSSNILGRWLMQDVHANPIEAMQLFADTQARWMIPIHHGTFYKRGGAEQEEIEEALDGHPLASRVVLLQVGQSVRFGQLAGALVSPQPHHLVIQGGPGQFVAGPAQ